MVLDQMNQSYKLKNWKLNVGYTNYGTPPQNKSNVTNDFLNCYSFNVYMLFMH